MKENPLGYHKSDCLSANDLGSSKVWFAQWRLPGDLVQICFAVRKDLKSISACSFVFMHKKPFSV